MKLEEIEIGKRYWVQFGIYAYDAKIVAKSQTKLAAEFNPVSSQRYSMTQVKGALSLPAGWKAYQICQYVLMMDPHEVLGLVAVPELGEVVEQKRWWEFWR